MKLASLPSVPTVPWTAINLDADAQSYIARAGVTSAPAKRSINNFVFGLKSLGLYSLLTGCWIGRSAYNAGTGTTVYDLVSDSLNGTMVNSPAWGVDGIVFSGGTQAVTTGRTQTMDGSWSAFVVARQTTTAAPNNRRFLGASNLSPTLLYANGATLTAANLGMYDSTSTAVTTLTVDVTSLKMLGVTYSVANRQNYFVSGSSFQTRSVAMLTSSHTVQLSSSAVVGNEGMVDGVISVAMVFGATELSANQVASLYTLLKQTICSDLSLP